MGVTALTVGISNTPAGFVFVTAGVITRAIMNECKHHNYLDENPSVPILDAAGRKLLGQSLVNLSEGKWDTFVEGQNDANEEGYILLISTKRFHDVKILEPFAAISSLVSQYLDYHNVPELQGWSCVEDDQ